MILPLTEDDALGRYCDHCWHLLATMSENHKRRSDLNAYYIRTYGISMDQYGVMHLQQRGRCAICMQFSGKALFVDHRHSDGSVRGLLCGTCNSGLGMFKDNVASLSRAITYLCERATVR